MVCSTFTQHWFNYHEVKGKLSKNTDTFLSVPTTDPRYVLNDFMRDAKYIFSVDRLFECLADHYNHECMLDFINDELSREDQRQLMKWVRKFHFSDVQHHFHEGLVKLRVEKGGEPTGMMVRSGIWNVPIYLMKYDLIAFAGMTYTAPKYTEELLYKSVLADNPKTQDAIEKYDISWAPSTPVPDVIVPPTPTHVRNNKPNTSGAGSSSNQEKRKGSNDKQPQPQVQFTDDLSLLETAGLDDVERQATSFPKWRSDGGGFTAFSLKGQLQRAKDVITKMPLTQLRNKNNSRAYTARLLLASFVQCENISCEQLFQAGVHTRAKSLAECFNQTGVDKKLCSSVMKKFNQCVVEGSKTKKAYGHSQAQAERQGT